MKIVEHPELRKFVEKKLLEGRSPESIAGRVTSREKQLGTISGDSIERFLKSVYGRKIEAARKKLRTVRGWARRRRKQKKLDGRKFIDSRPEIINRRGRVGDSEADFIVSGKDGRGYLLVLADRKLRASFIEKVLPVNLKNIRRAFEKIKLRYPEILTITEDNDILFKDHKELESLLGVKVYFCHPYHSWEKGTIENTNGEIRKYIPKGRDISKYSNKFIKKIEKKLNERFMECLNYSTPREALDLHRKQKKRPSGESKEKK